MTASPGGATWISGIALVVSNVIPLWGVFEHGWSVGLLLLLYWAESAVIGVLNIAKMIMIDSLRGVGLSFFFAFHYGIFMFVHGVFVVTMFLGGTKLNVRVVVDDLLSIRWQFLALLVSHTISFVVYWVLGDEKRGRKLQAQMGAPYGRIMVMHFVILLGGGALMWMRSPTGALVLFVILKTALDLAAHRHEHRRAAAA